MKLKKKLIALVAIGVAIGGAAGLYQAGKHQGMKLAPPAAGQEQAPAGTAAGADRKPLYWHDPMVPGQKFDKPGKSPFMDMQLVPVYPDAAGDEGTVTISPRVQQNLGVRTAVVARGSLASSVSAVGSVAYNERDVALVQARANGFVERLYVRAPLEPVKRGQPLMDLYVPDWVAAQEEFLAARRMQAGGVEGLADAARQRMRLAGMDEQQIRLVESTGKVHARVAVAAPSSGVVTELSAREGMTVMAGAPLFRINGVATIWVNAEVPENAAAAIRPGTVVEARTAALPNTVLKGKVSAILPEVNAATRTLKARIELANPSGQLVPGMFATLNFAPAASKDVILVPSEAIIRTGTRSVVMVAQADGKFVSANVETGMEANGQTEIRKGLAAGQKVVVSGQFLIDSDASLKATTDRMSGVPAPQDTRPAGPIHRGEGKVERIDEDEVTISHGPIATLQWGPMTMGFKVPPTGLSRNIKVGDSVSFEFTQSKEGSYDIVAVSPMTPPPARGNTTGVAK